MKYPTTSDISNILPTLKNNVVLCCEVVCKNELPGYVYPPKTDISLRKVTKNLILYNPPFYCQCLSYWNKTSQNVSPPWIFCWSPASSWWNTPPEPPVDSPVVLIDPRRPASFPEVWGETSWWLQPIWKIWVKMAIFQKKGMNIFKRNESTT